ncbi:hypothetical protein CN288_18050 [Bacillus sp. AFS023182]|nr:hypothetical protein CN288_18050 [Bacillus sp. AFS023182]
MHFRRNVMKYSIFCLADYYEEDNTLISSYYKEIQQQIILADLLDFDTFWVAEHHFKNEHGSLASPALFLAAASQNTEKIRLGVAVSVIPLHNPIRIAEDFAMLDVLSNGRMRFATGSGYLQYEFEGFNIKSDQRLSLLNEGIEVINRLWTEEKVNFQGKHFQVNTGLNIRPNRCVEPPMMAVVRTEAVHAMAKKGQPIFISSLSIKNIEELNELVREYKQIYLEHGHPENEMNISYCLNVVLDHSDEVAREAGINALQRLFDHRGIQRTPLDFIDENLCLFGSPSKVAKLLNQYIESGITELAISASFGQIGHKQACNTMDLLKKEVLPLVDKKNNVDYVVSK